MLRLPRNDALAGTLVGIMLASVFGIVLWFHGHPDHAVPFAVLWIASVHTVRLLHDQQSHMDDAGTGSDI